MGTPGVTGIDATVAAWSGGQQWLTGVLSYLQANRDYFMETMRRELPEVKVNRPEATYLAWLDFTWLNLPTTPYEFILKNARVALSDGVAFDPECHRFARLNFAQPVNIPDGLI